MTSIFILGNDHYARTPGSGPLTSDLVQIREQELAQRINFLPGRLRLRPGQPADYGPLGRFHYRAGPPATWARVVCIDFLPQEAERLSSLQHPDPSPARTIAIGVLSWPTPTSRGRREVFGLDPTDYGAQLHFANAQLRTISRVIVHPQFRGLGLAGVIIRLLCELCPTRFIEATARMGAIHPMFERAGMTRHESTQSDQRPYFWLDRLPHEPWPEGASTTQ